VHRILQAISKSAREAINKKIQNLFLYL